MDFSSARVGDQLFSIHYGPVRVRSICEYSICCERLDAPDVLTWFSDGRLYTGATFPDLYWSKPEITGGDVPPKRLVKKSVRVKFYKSPVSVQISANPVEDFNIPAYMCGLVGEKLIEIEVPE